MLQSRWSASGCRRTGKIRSARLKALLTCAVIVTWSGAVRPASWENAVSLVPGIAREALLKSGDVHHYRARLDAAGPWLIRVEQKGAGVVVEVAAPKTEFHSAGTPLARLGEAVLLIRAEQPEDCRFQVRREDAGAVPDRYRIRIERLKDATSKDRLRLSAEEALSRAGHGYLRGDAKGLRDSIEAYSEAQEHLLSLGLVRRRAEALESMALLQDRLGRSQQALANHHRSLSLWRSLDDVPFQAVVLTNLGLNLLQAGEADQAQRNFEEALSLFAFLGDRYGEAVARNNQCMISHLQGNLKAALDCYSGVHAVFQDLGRFGQAATLLNNIGYAHFSLGHPYQALDFYRRSLSHRRRLGDRGGQAETLINIAVTRRGMGELQQALEAYEQVRELQSNLGDERREGTTLNNIGVVYRRLGELERAEVYFKQALELRSKTGHRSGEITTLNRLGELESARGLLQAALKSHRQALSLARQVGNQRLEAVTRIRLGEAHLNSGQADAARRETRLAKEAGLQRPQDRAAALHTSGLASLQLGFYDEALSDLGQALRLRRKLLDSDAVDTLAALARTHLRRRELDRALSQAESALDFIEKQRRRVLAPDLRTSFLSTHQQVYRLLIDILMELHSVRPGEGYDLRALEASERARARGLLDLISQEGQIDWGVEPQLAQKRRLLLRRLSAQGDRQSKLLAAARPDPARSAQLEKDIEDVQAQLDALEAEIRRGDLDYAQLSQAPSIDAARIRGLLDSETLLLEYVLGEHCSFLWVVSREGVLSFQLPPRRRIEDAARRLYESLSVLSEFGRNELDSAALDLSRMILEPVEGELGRKRLAIVADGALHFIPFAVLPAAPSRSGPATATTPLILDHEITYLPSAAVLEAQRGRFESRQGASKWAIVLADPVFDPSDARVDEDVRSNSVPAASDIRQDLMRSARQSGLEGFDRLPSTRREALAIQALAPPGQAWIGLDFDASKDRALGGGLVEYRMVHFATHALVNSARPALSGLVLSLVDRQGHPHDGFLRLGDVFSLKLNADLVVLSGCRTALGREVRGEGLVGLTRGFMHAGAPRVAASLWWVQDAATAQFMQRFYEAMWREGQSPAAALRRTQLWMRQQRRFSSPFYWAAFIHQGEWR